VQEPTPGLTQARLKGISVSKSDVILFCDDDNWLQDDYLLVGMQRLNNQPSIGILGGLGEAVSTIPLPSWFEAHQNFYAVGPQFSQPGIVRGARNVVYGAGMFMVKSAFEKITAAGFNPISSDRKGNQLSSGGDSELCLAFQLAGHQIYYDDLLIFKHFIEEKRLTPDYLQRLKKGMAESRFVTRFYLDFLNGYRPKITKLFWLKELFYALFTLENFRSSGLKRNSVFIKFIINQRFKYNQQVDAIIQTCNSLSSLA
jgi:glycosyltransferase involved in cell wall biosynthesis